MHKAPFGTPNVYTLNQPWVHDWVDNKQQPPDRYGTRQPSGSTSIRRNKQASNSSGSHTGKAGGLPAHQVPMFDAGFFGGG